MKFIARFYTQFLFSFVLLVLTLPMAAAQGTTGGAGALSTLHERVQQEGHVRIVVGLKTAAVTGPHAAPSSARGATARRMAVGNARGKLLATLDSATINNIRHLNYLPYLALEVNAAALARLERNPQVASLTLDVLYRPVLDESSALIGADVAWGAGYSGAGEVIAIIDTGVDKFHPFLDGKVVSEACYSTTNSGTSNAVCASGSVASDSGLPCTSSGCGHGTHVAGIAAGNGISAGVGFSGVARDASLAAIQVFSEFYSTEDCDSVTPCVRAYLSDIIAGLDRVYELKTSAGLNIVSANLSLGGPNYSDQAACDADFPAMTTAITLLRQAGVATVAASGNEYDKSAISHPACITGVIAVGATTKTDMVASYSNSSPLVSLLAPGSSIYSSIPGGGFRYFSGTSMATPHVAGAWAVLKDMMPTASVTDVELALQNTGVLITDSSNGVTKPRIQVDAALALTPISDDLTLTLSADNASEVYVNGVLLGGTSNWKTPGLFSVALQPGANVIAVKGIDAGGIAGVLAELAWGAGTAVTDSTWKVSAEEVSGWETVGFDDSGWPTATSYGVYGVGPWNKRVAGFPTNSTAQWIWTADNFNDNRAYLRFTITLGDAPLVINTSTLPDAEVGQNYSQTALASGGTPPYSWSVLSGNLPDGLELDPENGSINGIPLSEEIANFTLQVQDAGSGLATQDLSLTVATPSATTELALTLSADNASEVYVNGVLLGGTSNWKTPGLFSVALQPGANVIAVKGIDAGGIAGVLAELAWGAGTAVTDSTWKVSAEEVSGWETVGFDDSGWPTATSYGVYGVGPWNKRVAGFPTNSTAQWIWTADNFNDNRAYLRFTITLGDAPLVINTSTLPDAEVGQNYSQTALASGGTPPYSWSVLSGNLPDGLELDANTGSIQGIPLTEEIANFTLQVQDAGSGLATQDLSLTVATPSATTELALTLSADNASEVYVNGVLLGGTSNWQSPGLFSVALQPGANVVAVKGIDAGGVAGVLAELAWGAGTAVTDSTWKVSAEEVSGWETVGFDDSSWPTATSYGVYGVNPWRTRVAGFPTNSTAQWIWTADNSNHNSAYLRFTIIAP